MPTELGFKIGKLPSLQLSIGAFASVLFCATAAAQTTIQKTPNTATAASAKLGPAKIISKPGIWETTILANLDSGAKSESIATRCITPQDLRSPEVLLPVHAVVGLTCTNRDVKFSGNKATWKIACIGNGQAIEGGGNLTFAAQTQTGSAKFAHGVGGKTVKTEQTIKAKFVSACYPPGTN